MSVWSRWGRSGWPCPGVLDTAEGRPGTRMALDTPETAITRVSLYYFFLLMIPSFVVIEQIVVNSSEGLILFFKIDSRWYHAR